MIVTPRLFPILISLRNRILWPSHRFVIVSIVPIQDTTTHSVRRGFAISIGTKSIHSRGLLSRRSKLLMALPTLLPSFPLLPPQGQSTPIPYSGRGNIISTYWTTNPPILVYTFDFQGQPSPPLINIIHFAYYLWKIDLTLDIPIG